MADVSKLITKKNSRPIWKKLKSSIVPIVTLSELNEIDKFIDKINRDLNNNNYVPNIGHGYLGFPKENGCTRFVPILTKEDMVVYYLLVLSLQDYLVHDLPGVYGAWRSVPTNANKDEGVSFEFESGVLGQEEAEIVEPYYADTLSRKAWFKNWNQFNELLASTCGTNGIGNYVLTSDVANFYDTIDVGKLCQKIRSDVSGNDDVVALLTYFLQYWDKRIKGYNPSSKGIPQEIISDASRMLANYYLLDFDKKFIEKCKRESIVYIRWADDIVLFGSSPKKLENMMHNASRIMLNLGLNLSAAKTVHYSRSEFRKYRALDLLAAIKNRDAKKFLKELKRFEVHCNENGGRIDTVVKASLNMLVNVPSSQTIFAKNYIEQNLENTAFSRH